jgi:hypothetical protein
MSAGGRAEAEDIIGDLGGVTVEEHFGRYHGMSLWREYPFGGGEENLAYTGLSRRIWREGQNAIDEYRFFNIKQWAALYLSCDEERYMMGCSYLGYTVFDRSVFVVATRLSIRGHKDYSHIMVRSFLCHVRRPLFRFLVLVGSTQEVEADDALVAKLKYICPEDLIGNSDEVWGRCPVVAGVEIKPPVQIGVPYPLHQTMLLRYGQRLPALSLSREKCIYFRRRDVVVATRPCMSYHVWGDLLRKMLRSGGCYGACSYTGLYSFCAGYLIPHGMIEGAGMCGYEEVMVGQFGAVAGNRAYEAAKEADYRLNKVVPNVDIPAGIQAVAELLEDEDRGLEVGEANGRGWRIIRESDMSMMGNFTIPATSPDIIPRRRSLGQEYIWRTIDSKWVQRRSGIKPEWVIQWEASQAELTKRISSLERSKKRGDVAAGKGSSGENSAAEESESTIARVGNLEVATTSGGRTTDVEVVAEIRRCPDCGKLTEVKLGEVFICFCTIVSAREGRERSSVEKSPVRGHGRYHLRNSCGTSGSNKGATSNGRKLKKEVRSKLRLKKFLEKKAEAAEGGQGPKN